ncbi:hypothetical protein V8G54_012607 [Vigna mungo]|uniref:NADP-dependent oxidoreductase domain-containing protein n=1 Tax=Vigna mungo TaxID=3915 RepID=A0AAQ3NRH0_VIGMU
MPVIGLGTASFPLPPHETLTSILIDAFEVGYRHFDTATFYGSEEPLGKAVDKALELGLVKSRDEVFITTKLLPADAHPDLIALRWIYEEGASAIVRSFNKERMKENIELFEWELKEEESEKFRHIPQRRMFSGINFVSENGPYKSLEELWDEDP